MIGILGGSFDPIHNGHLTVARYAYEKLNLTELRFMPCGQHAFAKSLQASREDRLKMLQLAILKHPEFTIDTYELNAAATSYTIDTLKHLRAATSSNTPLIWLLGIDAFLSLPKWKEWQTLLNYCHFVVIPRGDSSLIVPAELNTYFQQHQTAKVADLKQQPNGKIYFLSMSRVMISSTYIRTQFQQGIVPYQTLPDTVIDYITQHSLYRNKSDIESY